MFTRQFPHKKTSPTTLSRIYREYGVRRKKIRYTKLTTGRQKRKIRQTARDARDLLTDYVARGFRVIYIDETMFTKSTIPDREWTPKH